MTQQVRDVGVFGRWVEHFEQNDHVHARTGAAIGFDGSYEIVDAVRGPLVDSIRRFQLGESGDGEQLLCTAQRAGDPEYLRAAELFVAEEQQHAAGITPCGTGVGLRVLVADGDRRDRRGRLRSRPASSATCGTTS